MTPLLCALIDVKARARRPTPAAAEAALATTAAAPVGMELEPSAAPA